MKYTNHKSCIGKFHSSCNREIRLSKHQRHTLLSLNIQLLTPKNFIYDITTNIYKLTKLVKVYNVLYDMFCKRIHSKNSIDFSATTKYLF